MLYNNAGNRVSVTLPVISVMKVAAGLVVVLLTVALSYCDPSVDAEDVDNIHGVDDEVTEDFIEVMDGGPDVSELSRDRRHVGDHCIKYLYVMAFTSGRPDAGSDGDFRIYVRLNHTRAARRLPNLPGDDFESNKGDLWKLPLEDFFGFTGCVTLIDFRAIRLAEATTDGWNIDSVITFALTGDYHWDLLSVDLDIFETIDGNDGEERSIGLSILPYYDYYNYYDYMHD